MTAPRRVLIFRPGSLGDGVMSLPALHLVARAWPGAERRMLTNRPVSARAAPLAALLENSGLADGFLPFPPGLRRPAELLAVRRAIREFRPDALVYLAEARGTAGILRDAAFFRWCGIRRLYGLPLAPGLRRHRPLPAGIWESEAARLSRCLAPLGAVDLSEPAAWSLGFTPDEERSAEQALAGWPGAGAFAAWSPGTKVPVNDWGDANWRAVLAGLGAARPGLGLVLIGAAEEAARARLVAQVWPGPVRDLCGALAPRLAALVLRRARLFMGHDSGPMHLAAAVGTPVAAVFSARNEPGIWFPRGAGHHLFYHRTECFGCRRLECPDRGAECIRAVAPAQVTAALAGIPRA